MQTRNVETFHKMAETKRNDNIFTPPALAKRCIGLIPFAQGDIVMDPARGTGAFYDNFPSTVQKIWCEFDEGRDFMMFSGSVDWTVTNPPYTSLDRWFEKAFYVSRKGIGYLIHLHSITPRRIQMCNDNGFGITRLYIGKVTDWFGMVAFLILQKGYPNIIEHDRKAYKQI